MPIRPLLLDEDGEPLPLRFVCTLKPLEQSITSGVEPLVYLAAYGTTRTQFVHYRVSDSDVSIYEILGGRTEPLRIDPPPVY